MLKKAQNVEKYDFWRELYMGRDELISVNISILSGLKTHTNLFSWC